MTQLDEHGVRILDFVECYQRQYHRAPTYREIGAATGLVSNDHVARDLRRLVQEGYLSFSPGVSRSIVLLKTPRARTHSTNPSLFTLGIQPAFGVPSAARTTTSDDLSQLAFGLLEDEKDTFLLRARGNSMSDAMLRDGDLVLVKRGAQFNDGDVAAVYLKQVQRTTLKILKRENGRLRLQSPHPDAQPEHVKPADIEIRGTVLAIIRKRDM